ncbi:hypothetical protein BC827DRAFT_1233054, partial [Russula dissimulans]
MVKARSCLIFIYSVSEPLFGMGSVKTLQLIYQNVNVSGVTGQIINYSVRFLPTQRKNNRGYHSTRKIPDMVTSN